MPVSGAAVPNTTGPHGARPMTSLQYLLELQRDWARGETYEQTVKTAIANGGAYGLGLIYAKTMFNASEGH